MAAYPRILWQCTEYGIHGFHMGSMDSMAIQWYGIHGFDESMDSMSTTHGNPRIP
jgi:hypothetical protein